MKLVFVCLVVAVLAIVSEGMLLLYCYCYLTALLLSYLYDSAGNRDRGTQAHPAMQATLNLPGLHFDITLFL